MVEYSKYVIWALFAVFLILSAKELLPLQESSATKEIPKTSFLNTFSGPTLKFLYWRVFEQYVSILQEKYPDITVLGDTFPPPATRMFLANFTSVLKWIIIAMVISNNDPFRILGMATPNFFFWMLQNKMYACLMTFFLSNTIEGQLISTGAFEIILNGVPVWSKLATGRIPSPPELFQIIDNHVLFKSDAQSLQL